MNWRRLLIKVVVALVVLAIAYVWLSLNWSYSKGERVGYVQKLSQKGWICSTWEGEVALVSMPGTVTEKFLFSVRDDAVAKEINHALGKRVSLTYEEHKGIPSSCFGDTSYFVTGVRVVEDQRPLAPVAVPAAPAETTGSPR